MALKTCKTCGEPVKAVRTARGWQTIHTQTGNNYYPIERWIYI